MFTPARAFADSIIGENTYITEYFPVSSRTPHGVILPVYKSGRVPKVFSDIPKVYTFVNTFIQGPNQEPMLTKEEYEADLRGLVDFMTAKHNNNIRFEIKDIDDMYETYVSLHDVMYVAGIISICKMDTMAQISDATVVPPEGLQVCLGFETYVASLKRNLPMLVTDYFTAANLYKNYITHMQFSQACPTEDIPLLIDAPTAQDLSNLVYSIAPNLTEQTITNVVIMETESDAILSDYLSLAQTRFGLRERVAKQILVYHPTTLHKVMNGAMKQLGIITDRPTVLNKPKLTPEQEILAKANDIALM